MNRIATPLIRRNDNLDRRIRKATNPTNFRFNGNNAKSEMISNGIDYHKYVQYVLKKKGKMRTKYKRGDIFYGWQNAWRQLEVISILKYSKLLSKLLLPHSMCQSIYNKCFFNVKFTDVNVILVYISYFGTHWNLWRSWNFKIKGKRELSVFLIIKIYMHLRWYSKLQGKIITKYINCLISNIIELQENLL